jgi:DNA repair exonuclease SbcCD ATPase subunit
MIYFKYLRWKNFLSTGNVFTELKLDKAKSTLVVGENGAGKSTMLDALSFALYGKPFRKINKPQLMNTINQKGLEVQVEFKIGKKEYMIVRGVKPNKFEIYENDKIINQDAAARDYQEVLEKNILKLNHKSFSQIVVLGSSTFVPFMQLPSMHRREVIEDLLDIQIFSTMNTLLKEKVNTNKSEILDNDYNINLAEEKIKMQNQYIADLKQNTEKRVNEAKVKIAKAEKEKQDYNTLIEDLQTEVNELQESVSDFESLTKKKTKVEQLEYKLQEKIKKLEHDIEFYQDHDNCPVCKQDIEEDFKDQTIEEKEASLKETTEGFNQLQEEWKSINTRIKEIMTIQADISSKQSDISNNNSHINALNKIIDSINEDISKIDNTDKSDETDKKKLDTLQKALVKLESYKEELINERSVLDIASMILKDSGIKTRIIKQYIPVMNKLINKYLAAMDFFVDFQLDENFNETIKSRFRDVFSYASFSEGEKMRIDLALLFTWRAVSKLRNSVSTNLLIMDEVFDSSLDNTGTEEFLKILNDLTSDTNVFIISHKGDQLYDKFHSVIRFEKHKNFSRIAA